MRSIVAIAVVGLIAGCHTHLPTPDLERPRFMDGPATGAHGMVTQYTLALRRFDDREAHAILHTMEDEFPGYRSHNMIRKSAATRRYEYVTTAKVFKIEEWLYQLFQHMGFDADRDVLFEFDDGSITITKLSVERSLSEPEPETKPRFQ